MRRGPEGTISHLSRPATKVLSVGAMALRATLLVVAALALVNGHALPRSSSRALAARRVPPPRLDAAREKRASLDRDFAKIALPAFVQFAAEPLARLIDTAYLGRLGTNALGGAGAAIAAQYSVSKLYNDPLLRSTISIVAAQEGGEPA